MNDNLLYSRRLFLTRGVGLLSAAGTLPLFLDRSARAFAAEVAANPQGVGRPDRVLVVVQLGGGNDGLNTVVPYRNDNYYRARPRLSIAKDKALKVDDEFGFHPAAPGLKKLYDGGHLAVIHAVGYPNPNRSHFRSTDIWSTAQPESVAQTGWLGRYFDACCSGADPGAKPAKKKLTVEAAPPSSAISVTIDPPEALVGRKFLPLAFRTPDSMTYREGVKNPFVRDTFEKLNDLQDPEMGDGDQPMREERIKIPLGVNGSIQPADSGLTGEQEDFLQRTALSARVYAEQIKASTANVRNKVNYPMNKLATDLKLVAQMIASGLPTRVYYVTLGGFDTHSNQNMRHTQLMETLSSSLEAFVLDLKAMGHLDRTTVMTFSEFGRRVAENGSAGTDHGEAAPLFVMGGAVKPGFHGKFPDLAAGTLHRGDVPFQTDFRRVYATMLQDWLKADPVAVLGKKFETLAIFERA